MFQLANLYQSSVGSLIIGILAFFFLLVLILYRFRRCPSDKILVIFGMIGEGISSKCIHGGTAFIWPFVQDYQYLNLTPFMIEVSLTKALCRQNIRVDVPSRFTVAISTEPQTMVNAAERLLGMKQEEIQELAKEIIFGQLRLIIATRGIDELHSDREGFLGSLSANITAELKKVGMELINSNITDIKDESGYIDALGKEAAAKVVNEAKKSVAEQERNGAIGEADARRDERIHVAESQAKAVEGENQARISVANSEAERREKLSEAERRAIVAEKVHNAKAMEESYIAEQIAENARAEKMKATQKADVIVAAEIAKEKMQLDAEAEAETIRRHAKGEADGMLYEMEARAKGLYEILSKQADGLAKIIEAANGDAHSAAILMITNKLPELVKLQMEAIQNIKIDKITVWDSMNGENGTSNTANFISGLCKSVPPMEEIYKMVGMRLPSYLVESAPGDAKQETGENAKSADVGENTEKAEPLVFQTSDSE